MSEENSNLESNILNLPELCENDSDIDTKLKCDIKSEIEEIIEHILEPKIDSVVDLATHKVSIVTNIPESVIESLIDPIIESAVDHITDHVMKPIIESAVDHIPETIIEPLISFIEDIENKHVDGIIKEIEHNKINIIIRCFNYIIDNLFKYKEKSPNTKMDINKDSLLSECNHTSSDSETKSKFSLCSFTETDTIEHNSMPKVDIDNTNEPFLGITSDSTSA